MKVVLIGSGNVASHMGRALKASGHAVLQIWSATFENAAFLAAEVDATPIQDLSEISDEADFVIISVKDDAITQVVSKIVSNSIVVHTSGATDIDALSLLKRYGVLYPLQTFSKGKTLDFTGVPLCIEASDAESFVTLKNLAGSLSNTVFAVDSRKRRILHLAAAFACNFVNQLYSLSNDLLDQNGLDFDLLRPLIKETAEKVQYLLPTEAQTGPAVRNDQRTLEAHLELLQQQPELENIYQTLSDSIKKSHQK
jgi:predicted short-subunit dehydrogenase-like oxidoreductase (DUF2520 family)